MLSILIPTFDENLHQLVSELQKQALASRLSFEIIANDQCANGTHHQTNDALNELEGVTVTFWNERKGRSANRNYLADCAKGDKLLFMDSDSELVTDTFLKDISEQAALGKVICGMLYYRESPPPKEFYLRWKYGRKREMRSAMQRNKSPYQSFTSFVFLIHKSDFQKVRFDEDIKEYGHEDTLFGKHLKYEFIQPVHTNIPLKHAGLITADDFIDNVDQSIRSLVLLWEKGVIDEDFKVYALQQRLAKYQLDYFVSGIWKLTKPLIVWNLRSTMPSLYLLDFYKLGYFCSLRRGVKTTAKTLRS